MFVEVVRFFVVLLTTGAGYEIGRAITGVRGTPTPAVLVCSVLGAAVGYVGGGILGRLLSRGFGAAERSIDRTPAGVVVTAATGGLAGAAAGALVSMPLLLLVPPLWSVPVTALVIFVVASLGYRLALHRSRDLLGLMGLASSPFLPGVVGDGSAAPTIVDSSTVIDGRLLGVVRSGFLRERLLVPRFVLEEIQGVADAADPQRRRRGRRGLEILEALRTEIPVEVTDDEVPEVEAVDAKLVRLARRLHADLLTTDHNLARVAELQGVTVRNVNRLVEAVRPPFVAGDTIRVRIEADGTDEGQGVGYTDDGTMVVVSGAAGRVGSLVEASVTSAHQTSVGKMLFGRHLGDAKSADGGDAARAAAATLLPDGSEPG